MEKIYSRRRIKFPKINKVKLGAIIIIIGILFAIISFIMAAYPIFEASCKNKASSIAINVATEQVNEIMKDYEYEDLISIESSNNSDVTMIKAKIVPINEMIAKITSNIKNEIDKREQVEVSINLGAITGFSGLSAIGPKFYVKMESAGSVTADLKSEFTSVRH
jgi:sporulation protein YunB